MNLCNLEFNCRKPKGLNTTPSGVNTFFDDVGRSKQKKL